MFFIVAGNHIVLSIFTLTVILSVAGEPSWTRTIIATLNAFTTCLFSYIVRL